MTHLDYDQTGHDYRSSLRWLYLFLVPHRLDLLIVFSLSAVVTLTVLVQPYLTKLIIDDGLLSRDFDSLFIYSVSLLVIGITSTGLAGYNRIRYTRVSGEVLFSIREVVYDHLQRLPTGFFMNQRSGDLASRIDRDVAQIQRFAVDTLFTALSGLIGLFGTISLMLFLSWQLSVVLLIIIPAEFAYLRYMRPRIEQRNRELRERGADISSFLAEKIPLIKYIQSAGSEDRELTSFKQLNRFFLIDLISLQKTEFWTAAVPTVLVTSSRALVFLLGGYWVIQDQFALGSLIAFTAYIGMASGPVQSLLGLYMAWQRLRVSLDRVHIIMVEKPLATADGEDLPAGLTGELQFRDLVFSYPNNKPVLLNVNLAIPAGSKVGITGSSGIGKSTLLDLIQRHLDPESGSILIDGMDISRLNLKQWRQQIAIAPQDPVIFHDTMLNNIRYSKPCASDESILEVAAKTGLIELIDRLPDGANTLLNERGIGLSGGEKQRIALARALLQEPKLLILDEPTAAVDVRSEEALLIAIDSLFSDTTRLVVSHRQSLVDDADLKIQISEGGMVSVTTR